ncbi:hypothetical protein THARTR1_00959 [Trichoderma harzianum]|uniref:Uncharacterized protein n=1 Tax=Trichoderma harzianum TaxID=5544 RepID=A0A2K0UNW5_TRIHA|nr:hypothetical protein THARTR1_00959 [Trichoderma harzianum]
MREKLERVVKALQPVIIEAIEWKPVHDTDKEPGKQEEYIPQQQFNLGSIFDAIIGLIAEADETKTASQNPLASAILTRMSTADDHSFKAITGILDQRVKVIKQKIKHQDPDHELQRNRMSTAMEYLLDRAKKPDMTFQQRFLEKVADSTTKLSSTKKSQDTTLDASKESGSAVVVDNSEN